VDNSAPTRVSDEVLADLRRRLRSTRLVAAPGTGWNRGTDHNYLQELVRYWANAYDWRPAEDRILALPWQRAGGMRVVRQRGPDSAPVVVLLHGWPDSVLRFERLLPLLTDLTVVVPALPGFPFADSPGSAGADMADPIAGALSELGYDRYVVAGGDIGSSVADALARRQPEHVAALYLTDVPARLLATVPESDLTDDDRSYRARAAEWQATDGAYAAEQATRPATLAVALGDSPAGLAAWLIEKYRAWSDCSGDVESVFPRDDLLTWITAYWVTASVGTSFAPYSERRAPVASRITAPAIVSMFPKEPLQAPRSTAERFLDVRVWDEPPRGGHFPAWEQPDAFASALRRAVALA
jgi:pimeloyl-ACP methyl ester carboxylesterase